MLGDLAAMLECADAIRNNAVTVWDRRQWQQQQQQPRSLDWEVGSYASSASASSASSAGIRPQPVAVRRIDKDYVGLLVWSGQNLMCGAEERGWRATEQLLDGLLQVGYAAPAPYCPPPCHPFGDSICLTLNVATPLPPQVLEVSLKGLLPPVGALRAPYVAAEAAGPNLDANGRKTVAGATSPPESIRLDYCSRDNRTVTFQLDMCGVHRPIRATRSFIKPSFRQAGSGGGASTTSSAEAAREIEGKLELAAAVVCVAAASALHGGVFLGQGLASVLPAHALIAGPYALLLLLALLLQLNPAAAVVSGGRRFWGGDPVSGQQQQRMTMMRTLACASHVAAMLSLRVAQLLMLQGHIGVPLAMAESIRLALDWPAQVRSPPVNCCSYSLRRPVCVCVVVPQVCALPYYFTCTSNPYHMYC